MSDVSICWIHKADSCYIAGLYVKFYYSSIDIDTIFCQINMPATMHAPWLEFDWPYLRHYLTDLNPMFSTWSYGIQESTLRVSLKSDKDKGSVSACAHSVFIQWNMVAYKVCIKATISSQTISKLIYLASEKMRGALVTGCEFTSRYCTLECMMRAGLN